MWQPWICSSFLIHRTEMRRPCGAASRETSARVVPKRKSPSTQATNGELGAGKAPSGQSTKLGKVARKAALLRLWAGTYSCATARKGEVIAIVKTRRPAVVLFRLARVRCEDTTSWRLDVRLVLDPRDTKTPKSLGK